MSGDFPPILNSSIRSWNYPCTSPQIVTGHFTGVTFDSVDKISFAYNFLMPVILTLSHKVLTSCSEMGLKSLSWSIYLSRIEISLSERIGVCDIFFSVILLKLITKF